MRRLGLCLVLLAGCSSATSTSSGGLPASVTAATTIAGAASRPVGTPSPASSAAAAGNATTTVPDASSATTTVAPASSVAQPSVTAVPLGDPSSCQLDGPPTDGSSEITFVRDGRMWGLFGDRTTPRCLAVMQPGDDGPISWGPQGDRYLIGNQTFVVGDKRASTGFTNGQVATWSSPKGTAILRVDPAKLTVAKRNNLADPTITALPVMAEAYDALYHPAGRNIAVVGRPTHDSPYGIWLISNNGENPKLITSGEDAKRIRLLRWESGGNQLQFYAEHLDGTEHAHALQFPGLALTDLVTSGSSTRLADLQRNVAAGVVEGECSAGTARLSVYFSPTGSLFPLPVRDVRLILRDEQTFVATRQNSCDGPEDLWQWTYGGPLKKRAEGVTGIAVRSKAGQPNELPDDITAQAPG